jgi:predicted nucleic acid-binding protein
VIYLDAAAVVKMVRSEAESVDLVRWLNDRTDASLVSSALVEIEVPRALRRSAPQALAGVPSALARLYRVEIDATVRATAAAYEDQLLRSLDAIHLATAQVLASGSGAELEAFVTYDKRLLTAAAAAGLPTASPGAS